MQMNGFVRAVENFFTIFYFEGKPYFWANAIQLLKIFNWKIRERVKIYSRGKIDVGS